ncbi:MAG: ATP-dependent sacrificial sulfur transferase LarE [Candidatus Eisenbacteria bacterium]
MSAEANSERAGERGAMDALREWLASCPGAVVAFSGGVDSSLLLAVAQEVLGRRVLAVTARSSLSCGAEQAMALAVIRHLGARHRIIDWDPLRLPPVRNNDPDRCYHCKHAVLQAVRALAQREGTAVVLDGSNADDRGDYRPGVQALRELGIRSPLAEVGMGKTAIRALARSRGLPNWDAPALACLATRVPFGEVLTPARLARIDAAEERIRAVGIGQVRVRDHDGEARIEVSAEELPILREHSRWREIEGALAGLGFRSVVLDPNGYRQGSLNRFAKGTQRQD